MPPKIRWRIKGFEEIRRSPEMVADLERRTNAIAAVAGEGMEPSVIQGRTRARGSVITATAEARRNNAETNALIRGLDAGR